jgi:hypothetical protein
VVTHLPAALVGPHRKVAQHAVKVIASVELKLATNAGATVIPNHLAVALVGKPTGAPHHVMLTVAVLTCK